MMPPIVPAATAMASSPLILIEPEEEDVQLQDPMLDSVFGEFIVEPLAESLGFESIRFRDWCGGGVV